MHEWTTLDRRRIADFSPFLMLEARRVRTPDGRLVDPWTWIDTPDYVNVFAVTTICQLVALEVHKYAVGCSSLALPGGFIEPHEQPETAARRELQEETGYGGGRWRPLGTYVVDANRGAGRAHFFLALDVVPQGPTVDDDLEHPSVRLLSPAELDEALSHAAFRALPWAACAALGRAAWEADRRAD
ncbi:MAG: NUDIX hydrolase [Kiritimatiellae bacterium]|nr:NUDIX hydrolase [Kiritimatiellia bacterium]